MSGDECRDDRVRNSGLLRGKHGDSSVKSLWIFLRQMQGQDVRNSGYFSGKNWGRKVRNMWIIYDEYRNEMSKLGVYTEMSSCIFSGSIDQRGWFRMLGKPCFGAVRCREAVGAQDTSSYRYASSVVIFKIFSGSDAGGRYLKTDVASETAEQAKQERNSEVRGGISKARSGTKGSEE